MTRIWVAHANTPYHHLLRTQSTAPLPTNSVIPKPGIKHYGTTKTSLIIVMVCVGTNIRPPISNRVSVICNPRPRLPQPTWLMMSHQKNNLLPINLFRPMPIGGSLSDTLRPMTLPLLRTLLRPSASAPVGQ